MVLQFDIEILPEHGFEPPGKGIGFLIPVVEQVLGDIPGQAGGEAHKALTMLGKQIVVDAGFVVEAVDESLGGQIHEVLIANLVLGQEDEVGVLPVRLAVLGHIAPGRHIGLDAQDRLDALLFALPIEVDDPVHDPMVRDRHGALPQCLGAGHQGRYARRPVQKGVLGMNMQMHEGNGHGAHLQMVSLYCIIPFLTIKEKK